MVTYGKVGSHNGHKEQTVTIRPGTEDWNGFHVRLGRNEDFKNWDMWLGTSEPTDNTGTKMFRYIGAGDIRQCKKYIETVLLPKLEVLKPLDGWDYDGAAYEHANELIPAGSDKCGRDYRGA